MSSQIVALLLTGALVALLAVLTALEFLRSGMVDPTVAGLAVATIGAFVGLLSHLGTTNGGPKPPAG